MSNVCKGPGAFGVGWDDREIILIQVVEHDSVTTSYFHPSNDEIRKICDEHEFDPDMVFDMLLKRGSAHTFIFDAPTYRLHCKVENNERRKKAVEDVLQTKLNYVQWDRIQRYIKPELYVDANR